MTTELTNRIVKCRKEHVCDWCGEKILKDAQARYRAGVFEGDFFSGHQHFECYDAMTRSDFDYDGGYTQCDQMRGKTLDESHA